MYIKELINCVEKRPLMYVQEEKISYISHLLMGYCLAASHNNIPSEMDKHFWSWFGNWLDNWIKIKYNKDFKFKAYWCETLKDITQDERKAVQLFYKLCEQFFSDYEEGVGYFEWRNTEISKY